jgi:hypothetical protein
VSDGGGGGCWWGVGWWRDRVGDGWWGMVVREVEGGGVPRYFPLAAKFKSRG